MVKVLILDHSKSVRNILRERLEYEGFSTEAAEDEEAASNMCEKIPFDVILSDTGCKIPDKGVPFIVLSSEASIDSAVEAVRNGAQDYLTKPIDMNRLLQSIHRTIDDPAPVPAPAAAPARRTRRGHNAQTEHIIGTSPQIEHVRLLIDKVAPCEARVLITGENGTGKELVARWLHAKSNRAAAPFVEVNCAAIPSELIESELFGHERGAFTSAIKQRRGKFEQADGGTLFMDEIGDMSLAAQAKVLRALQENRISRVGSDKDIEVNVRVIAATNKNLREEIAKGNFREDLFFRLSVFRIHLPSLRERPGDIAEYARFFAAQFADRMGRRIDTIDKGYIAALERHAWHGNVRELRNVVERSLIMAEGNALTVGCLSPEFHAASCDGSVPDSMALDALERHHILRVLEYTKGNKAEAARLLGIGIATLYRKLESYGMKP